MKKLAIIGASEFQNPLILKAKELGYETHVFAWECGDIGEKTCDFFYPISIVEKEKILKKCQEIGIAGICSIGSDLATLTVNYVSREMGLTVNPQTNDYNATNKFLMRKKLKESGVKSPKFICVGLDYDEKIIQETFDFPVIVKPTDRSGSRAITKVSKLSDLSEAVEAAVDASFEKKAIIEDCIEGKEYSCECISFDGHHQFLAFTEKYTTGAPNFIETGHIEPSDILSDKYEEYQNEIFKALDALDIKYGASHSEFKIDKENRLNIIEIGSRMGGDCIGSDLVSLSTGNDFIKMVIDCAVGNKISELNNFSKCACIRFVFNQKDLDLLNSIEINDDIQLFRKEIKKIENVEVTDSSSRFGYFIFTCKSREKALEILEK